ncbi:hypothetical protein CDD82_1121 [Ophiocordyceps australis]|uniref:Zn(2)-C6 fungal-type domain-containing protein n=1 Tax=Ophiocordyceps australis TaxID=1399860 RepID=A0A2C5ZN99_9HYPO|nr:hypothetical protein CDD82_1121 [Ophiocordyceps australis]
MSIPRHDSSSRNPVRLRSACDLCHHSKIKCNGGNPCSGCLKLRLPCNYSSPKRTGRPRGAKNKLTLQRLRARDASEMERNAASSSSSASSCEPASTPSTAGYSGFDADFMTGYLDPLLADLNPVSSQTSFMPSPGFLHQNILNHSPTFSHSPVSIPHGPSLEPCPLNPALKPCDCPSQLATLFVQLKAYTRTNSNIQPAAAISHVREGIETCRRHLKCTSCTDSCDTDSLLLCIMQLRIILSVITKIHRSLHLDCQTLFFLQASADSHTPVRYGLAQEESQAVLRLLLLRSLTAVVAILDQIRERISPTSLLLDPASGLRSPDSGCFGESALPSPKTRLSRRRESAEASNDPSVMLSLLSLIESAHEMKKKIAADE